MGFLKLCIIGFKNVYKKYVNTLNENEYFCLKLVFLIKKKHRKR